MSFFGEENHGRWLHAFSDHSLDIVTLSQCIALVLSGDGYQLVMADFKITSDTKPRLKAFSGTSIISEQILPDIPSSVCTFLVDKTQPTNPAVGVACGSEILVFRNNKPYYKYSLRKLPISELEEEVWRKLGDAHPDDIAGLVELLRAATFEELTSRSQTFLFLPPEKWDSFINEYKNITLERKTVITCMSPLLRKVNDSLYCIIVGTEIGDVIFIDPQGFNILHEARVCSMNVTPFAICCVGQYEVEFRCVIACREGVVCILKRGWLEGHILFTVTKGSIVAIAIVPDELTIIVATNDGSLLCYNKKGKKLWNITLPNKPVTLTIVPLKHFNCNLVAVALEGGTVLFYKGRKRIDTIVAASTVGAITFGPLGQEENVLILITTDGTLLIKILKRTADYDDASLSNSHITDNAQPMKALTIPKKNKLFVDQTNRERQNAIEIHQIFQQELCRLRLLAARTTASLIKTTEVSVTPINLHAQVVGLGPTFTLTISIVNRDEEQSISELEMIFHVSTTAYTLSQSYIQLPTLHPGIIYQFNTKVIEKRPYKWNNDGNITAPTVEIEEMTYTPLKIFIVKKGETQPLSASRIQLPLTECIVF